MGNLIVLSVNQFTGLIVKPTNNLKKFLDNAFTIPRQSGSSTNKRDKLKWIRRKQDGVPYEQHIRGLEVQLLQLIKRSRNDIYRINEISVIHRQKPLPC